jgi:hypothetical protein
LTRRGGCLGFSSMYSSHSLKGPAFGVIPINQGSLSTPRSNPVSPRNALGEVDLIGSSLLTATHPDIVGLTVLAYNTHDPTGKTLGGCEPPENRETTLSYRPFARRSGCVVCHYYG